MRCFAVKTAKRRNMKSKFKVLVIVLVILVALVVGMVVSNHHKVNHRGQLLGVLVIYINAEALGLRLDDVAHIVQLPDGNFALTYLCLRNLLHEFVKCDGNESDDSRFLHFLFLCRPLLYRLVFTEIGMCAVVSMNLHLFHCGSALCIEFKT